MIDPEAPVFPNNVVLALSEVAEDLDEEVVVLRRPIRSSDPNVTLGIFASQWVPDESSYEMGGAPAVLGGARHEPTLNSYLISIQALVKDMDEVRGLNKHSVFAKMVRDMLLRDPETGIALDSLSVTDRFGRVERVQRRRVRTQRYMSNDISGTWLYLATIEFLIETETT